ncbi:Reverse transcriptase domain-containing protein, partial [Aphis craccivora]
MYKLNDINATLDIFNTVVLDAINQTVPKTLSRSCLFPKWFSKDLCVLIKQKKRQHKLFKSSGNNDDYETFSALRKKCKIMSKLCYKKHVERIQTSITKNPKYFWSFIKNKQKCNVVPRNITDGINIAKNMDDTVNIFKSYFESVYSQPNNNVSHIRCYNTDINFSTCQLTIIEIFDTLRNLSYKTKSGPDQIPEIIYKKCYFSLTCPIHYLFNLSLSSGCFPDQWKSSFIYPVFKSGNRNNVSNYRPISQLSSLPKTFEKLLVPKFTTVFNKVVSDNQHGFRHSRSTTTNLLIYYTDLISLISKGIQVDAVYTDIK